MTNAVRGRFTVELDGKTYTLEYTIDALCQLEDELDLSSAEILRKVAAGEATRMRFVRALIWGALREHHPQVTVKAAGELCLKPGGTALAPAAMQAFAGAWPEAEGEAEIPRRPQPTDTAGTGPASRSSGTNAAVGRRKATGARRRAASSGS